MEIGIFVQCHWWQSKEVVFQDFYQYAYYKYSLHCEGCLFVIFHKKDYKDALELELHLSFKYNILFTGICKRSFGLQRDSRNNNFAVDKYEKVEVWDVGNFEWTTYLWQVWNINME